MCGRYTLQQADQLPLRFEASATADVRAALTPRYNIAPTLPIPIVVETEPGKRQIALAQWGLTPHKKTGKSFLAFNARAETLTERPLFRRLVPHSRCLIPGDGFIEWTKAGKARDPHLISLADGEIFAFAGLLDRWIDESGEERAACTIITTTPNDLVGQIHDRMPVILPREDEATWIDSRIEKVGELLPLLAPYTAGQMATRPLDRAINSSRIDSPDLLATVH